MKTFQHHVLTYMEVGCWGGSQRRQKRENCFDRSFKCCCEILSLRLTTTCFRWV